MDTQSGFEREITERLQKVESAVATLSEKLDLLAGGPSPRPEPARSHAPSAGPAQARPLGRPMARPRIASVDVEHRGPDWYLARAGAGLTVVAVILLYQYAVGHGWITPLVRVLIGAAIGGSLMYWGRKMPPSAEDDAFPVAIRELMMGAALAAWYITSFAASSNYHLISHASSRYLFLLLSIIGGVLSLKERRSGLALIAITAGFLGPMILSDGAPSQASYAFYLAVLGGLSVVLYLVRGWQTVLWISFVALALSLSLPAFYASGILLTVMAAAFTAAYTRAPSLRKSLVATGSPRYAEPARSKFATHFLTDAGTFFKLLSPAAGSLQSLSLWIITIAAPVTGVSLLGRAWPAVNVAVWGALEIVLAIAAYRLCTSLTDENGELTHVTGAAALVWGTLGAIAAAHGLVSAKLVSHDTLALAIGSVASIAAIHVIDVPRHVAVIKVGILMSAIAVLAVLFNEASFVNTTVIVGDRIKIGMSIAEVIAIVAGVLSWQKLNRSTTNERAANALILMSYAAALLVDARVLSEIWRPLVTASFAVAGTILLLKSRKEDNRILLAVAGGTLALVMFRLFFVDMADVDTLWRVLLFLGVGALFLFTSRQLQLSRKQAAAESP